MNKEVFQNAVIQTHCLYTLRVWGHSCHPLHKPGQGGTRPLTLKLPIERSIHSLGILNPVLSKPLRYASYLFSPKQATSPVLAISTPSMASAPAKREKENWGTLKHKTNQRKQINWVCRVLLFHFSLCRFWYRTSHWNINWKTSYSCMKIVVFNDMTPVINNKAVALSLFFIIKNHCF